MLIESFIIPLFFFWVISQVILLDHFKISCTSPLAVPQNGSAPKPFLTTSDDMHHCSAAPTYSRHCHEIISQKTPLLRPSRSWPGVHHGTGGDRVGRSTRQLEIRTPTDLTGARPDSPWFSTEAGIEYSWKSYLILSCMYWNLASAKLKILSSDWLLLCHHDYRSSVPDP